MSMYAHYVGVDISFKTATIAWQGTSRTKPTVIEIKQTQKSYDKLIKRLHPLDDPSRVLVVMEATGTYWMKLAYALVEADFAVSVVNPIEP